MKKTYISLGVFLGSIFVFLLNTKAHAADPFRTVGNCYCGNVPTTLKERKVKSWSTVKGKVTDIKTFQPNKITALQHVKVKITGEVKGPLKKGKVITLVTYKNPDFCGRTFKKNAEYAFFLGNPAKNSIAGKVGPNRHDVDQCNGVVAWTKDTRFELNVDNNLRRQRAQARNNMSRALVQDDDVDKVLLKINQQIARATYKTQTRGKKLTAQEGGYQCEAKLEAIHESKYAQAWMTYCTKENGHRSDGIYTVAFRGSKGLKELMNQVKDGFVIPIRPLAELEAAQPVHGPLTLKYWANRYNSLERFVHAWSVKNGSWHRRVVFTGHSMGGALAHIANYIEVQTIGYSDSHLRSSHAVSFNAPKIFFSTSGRNKYRDDYAKPTSRGKKGAIVVQRSHDPVNSFPLGYHGYQLNTTYTAPAFVFPSNPYGGLTHFTLTEALELDKNHRTQFDDLELDEAAALLSSNFWALQFD
ncbi:MAG: hypothetical protein AAGB12_14565 [Pseudomonadota bacterium]